MIFALIPLSFGGIFLVFSIFHFFEKGFLFNNAYLYASPKERETMDKRPYYRQSAIVLLLCAAIFFLLALEVVLRVGWLHIIWALIALVTLIYAIASTVGIEKNKNKKS